MNTQNVLIDRLGAQGDGIADTDHGAVYVPFTLPGELVSAEVDKSRGHLITVEKPAPARVKPPCPHFGPHGVQCGGCSLQHMRQTDYETWKRQRVVDALATRGIKANVEPLVRCRPGSRRRAVFSARKTVQGIVLGFNQAATHRIIPVDTCPILVPAIEQKLGALKALAQHLSADTKPFRISVLETLSGLDVTVQQKYLPEKMRQSAIQVATEIGLARLSLTDEILIERQKPALDLSGVSVVPPSGAFVQACRDAQSAMTALVSSHLAGLKRTVDLFSGCGTFTLPLAKGATIHAIENDGPALAALDHAARHHHGLKPVTTERRDLFRRPMRVSELKGFGGAVFDPPRAGADAQSTELANSTVKKIAAVSCNPATLARDLRILIDGGFQIRSVTPIDQFLWSPHVEAVALLER
ncbi:MAG: class I SAM-dependent RNA methyltransferase [Alphaproteobacteria bacterium]|nr:class I SAM-dependent RNA methyltransferase [Alphaproteobacteria bacterium]